MASVPREPDETQKENIQSTKMTQTYLLLLTHTLLIHRLIITI